METEWVNLINVIESRLIPLEGNLCKALNSLQTQGKNKIEIICIIACRSSRKLGLSFFEAWSPGRKAAKEAVYLANKLANKRIRLMVCR